MGSTSHGRQGRQDRQQPPLPCFPQHPCPPPGTMHSLSTHSSSQGRSSARAGESNRSYRKEGFPVIHGFGPAPDVVPTGDCLSRAACRHREKIFGAGSMRVDAEPTGRWSLNPACFDRPSRRPISPPHTQTSHRLTGSSGCPEAK